MEAMKPCRCCGSLVVKEYDSYEICPVCGWEDDEYQYDYPDSIGGANKTCLNEAKNAFHSTGLKTATS